MTDAMRPFREVVADRHAFIQKMKAERGRKVAGYFCDYAPEEILWAAGYDTVRITGGQGNVVAADHYLQSNVCSFSRRCFEQAMTGVYDYLDALVVPHTCDVINKLYDLWAYRRKDPQFLNYLYIPHKVFDPQAPMVMGGEIRRLKKELEAHLGAEITKDAIADAIKLFDESRALLKKIYQLRQSDPPRLSGVDAFTVALSALLAPKDLHLGWMKDLLAELEAKPGALESRPRVLVAASMLDDLSLIAAIEDAGAWVVSEDSCVSTRYFTDLVGDPGADPIKALTTRYLNKLPCPRSIGSLPPRWEHIKRMVEDYKAGGVIFYILRCCDAHLFQYPLLRERLGKLGAAEMRIQGDQTAGIGEGIKNRLKAFTEMLSP